MSDRFMSVYVQENARNLKVYNIFFRKGGRRRKPILATSKKGVSLARIVA